MGVKASSDIAEQVNVLLMVVCGARPEIRNALITISNAPHSQPHGFAEALLGANNRLRNAKAAASSSSFGDVSLFVAMENAIVQLPDGGKGAKWFDFACVLVEDSAGKQTQTYSAMVQFPTAECDQGLSAGTFETATVGGAVAARLQREAGGGVMIDGQDPHAALTAGSLIREEILRDAVKICIGQLASGVE